MPAAVTELPPRPATITSHGARWLFLLIAICSLAGIVLSALSLQRHYAKSASTFCDFNQQFNCDIVNRSEYSSIMGIPVAAIGLAGYTLLLLLSTLWRSRPETPTGLLLASVAGLAFALYLTYIEEHVLMTWCILCLASLAAISLITLLSVPVKIKSRRAAS
jgi:vitamin-K-epoxide reductase (warfarin-sensitive)